MGIDSKSSLKVLNLSLFASIRGRQKNKKMTNEPNFLRSWCAIAVCLKKQTQNKPNSLSSGRPKGILTFALSPLPFAMVSPNEPNSTRSVALELVPGVQNLTETKSSANYETCANEPNF
jgi:hypothetical protein